MAEKKKLVARPASERGAVITKAEFVGLMVLLAQKDRAKYRELRAQGWAGAIPLKSECPN